MRELPSKPREARVAPVRTSGCRGHSSGQRAHHDSSPRKHWGTLATGFVACLGLSLQVLPLKQNGPCRAQHMGPGVGPRPPVCVQTGNSLLPGSLPALCKMGMKLQPGVPGEKAHKVMKGHDHRACLVGRAPSTVAGVLAAHVIGGTAVSTESSEELTPSRAGLPGPGFLQTQVQARTPLE